jgi:RNA polymerase sigma factor (sigma-70 family)
MRTPADPSEHVPAELQMDLWRRYRRSGDRRVRDRLVVIFAPLVHHVVRHHGEALPEGCEFEDLVSGGLEALIRAIDQYEPGQRRTLEQHVWHRVHRGVRDEFARYAPAVLATGAVPDGFDAAADPALASERREAREHFRDAFRQLPERERNIAVMRHVDGLTLREIGELLGVTESRVCQIDARLRRGLRVTLADDEALLAAVA